MPPAVLSEMTAPMSRPMRGLPTRKLERRRERGAEKCCRKEDDAPNAATKKRGAHARKLGPR